MHMKIAFQILGGKNWSVGPVLLRNLFHILWKTYGKEIELYLIAPSTSQDALDYARLLKVNDIIWYKMPRPWSGFWATDLIIKRLSSYDIYKEYVLKQQEIQVVYGAQLCYRYRKIRTLSLLPDFQHIHFPEMFSDEECLLRDRLYLKSAKVSTRIMLLSNAAKKDFESFAPMYADKARVLHPISYIPQSTYEYDLRYIINMYNLPEKFIYLPNAFWKHKNHEFVFKSIKLLKDKGIKVYVVCTGNQTDNRHPTYFGDLFCKLSQWNILDQIIYIGLIPHEHVLSLMRQSICVLNPSLFEGWGMAVSEATSLGKQVLISDIPSHREQNQDHQGCHR